MIDQTQQLPGDLLFESSIDVMIAIDMNGIITAWNSAATTLFNYKASEVLGKPITDIVPTAITDGELLKAIGEAHKGFKGFLPASASIPHRSLVETHVIPLRKDDAVMGILLLKHDVSYRIAKEKELQSLNAELQNRLRQLHLTSTELSQLTDIASHNIRGPIREIYTTVEALLSSEARVMSHSGRASFRRIQSSLNRMSLLLDDIVTLTQINVAGRPEEMVNMDDMVSELKTQFAKKITDSKTDLSFGDLCEIRAHRNQVLLLLQQIISNLIKFTENVAPKIRIECRKADYIAKDHTGKTGSYYRLSISHNGTVFDQVDAGLELNVTDNKNFQNYTGPAIAMVIAGRVMEVHNGFLLVEKTGNGDTRIDCYFPDFGERV